MRSFLTPSLLALFIAGIMTPALAAKTPAASGPTLSLKDYLEQVSSKHLGLRASMQLAGAAKLTSGEASTIFAPALIGNAASMSEGRSNPLQPDQHFAMQTYNLGVSQATRIGLNGKLTYNHLAVPGMGDYNSTYYQLDLSASLWRNFLGNELRSQASLIESGALAKSFAQSFAVKSMLLEGEANYWRLALAREMVATHKDAVERALKIFDWTRRRVRLQLADRSETLQATTNLQARRLELRTAEDEERTASLAFNSSRGVLGEKVSESFPALTLEMIASLKAPERSTQRDDVRAAEFQARASRANAELSREKNKPTVELYGSALLNDPNAPSGALALLIPISSRPQSAIGVKLSAPLNFGTLADTREGYAAEAMAADWQYQRKAFDEERDWQELNAKFRDAKERYQLFSDLEKTQKEKPDFERDRHTHGRSTLQQVFSFESDYETAQLGRLRTLAEILTLNAQLKLYGATYESR